MNKNIIMIVGALVVVLVAIFWVQSSIVRSLQSNSESVIQGTTATPTSTQSSTTSSSVQKAPVKETVGKKTTISAPVHKH